MFIQGFKPVIDHNSQRGVVYQTLPSTSPANTLSWERKLSEWQFLHEWVQ